MTYADRSLMSADHLRAELARHTYKPGWRFAVADRHIPGAATLVVSYLAPDSYHPEREVRLQRLLTVPPYLTGDDFAAWFRDELGRSELHERDEWHRVDGLLLHDPHSTDFRR